jgi:hypothetical protein
VNETPPQEKVWQWSLQTTIPAAPLDHSWCLTPASVTFGPDPRPKRLPQAVSEALIAITRERLANERPTFRHCARLLDAIGRVVSWHDARLALTVKWMMLPLNDIARDMLSPGFRPSRPTNETVPTEWLDLKETAVRALDQAVELGYGERKTAARIAELLRRKIGTTVRVHTVMDWRRDYRRQTAHTSMGSTARKRYARPLPAEMGSTAKERFESLMARLERDTETIAKPNP